MTTDPAKQEQASYRATFADLAALAAGPEGPGDGLDSQLADFFDAEEELVYDVRLPQQADQQSPPGVLVYISPKPGARLPDGWAQVLDEQNLIWVGARDSGNEVHVARRVALALLAPVVAAQVGAVDHSRQFLIGFSGGGRVGSMMMPVYPTVFAGAIFVCGANPLTVVSEDVLAQLADRPLTFVTGTGDFNLQDTHMSFATYQQAGLVRLKLMVIEGMGHALPDADDLAVALTSLVETANAGVRHHR